jgi:hypothetical protein
LVDPIGEDTLRFFARSAQGRFWIWNDWWCQFRQDRKQETILEYAVATVCISSASGQPLG